MNNQPKLTEFEDRFLFSNKEIPAHAKGHKKVMPPITKQEFSVAIENEKRMATLETLIDVYSEERKETNESLRQIKETLILLNSNVLNHQKNTDEKIAELEAIAITQNKDSFISFVKTNFKFIIIVAVAFFGTGGLTAEAIKALIGL